jgi:tRNA-2-methylthio-N6-dimethylallyladenosine synthase
MNEYDSDKMADVLNAAQGYEPTRTWSEADLILFNTCSVREKAQEKVFSATWAASSTSSQGRADRRGRLRGQPGRRRDHQARALCGRGVRPADPAPPARDAEPARSAAGPPAGGHQLPEIEKFDHLPPARVEGARPLCPSWKAAANTAATAWCPTPAAKKSAARLTTC